MAPHATQREAFPLRRLRVGECILPIREDRPAGFVCFHNPIFPVGHGDINYLQNLSLNWQSVLTVSKHFPHSYFFNAFSDWSKKARDMVQALKKLNGETKITPHEIYHWDQHGSLNSFQWLFGTLSRSHRPLGRTWNGSKARHVQFTIPLLLNVVTLLLSVDMAIIHTGINIYIYACTHTCIDFLAQHPKYPLHYTRYYYKMASIVLPSQCDFVALPMKK